MRDTRDLDIPLIPFTAEDPTLRDSRFWTVPLDVILAAEEEAARLSRDHGAELMDIVRRIHLPETRRAA